MLYVHYIHLQSWPVLCTTYKYMIKQMQRGYLQEPNNSLYTSKNKKYKKKEKNKKERTHTRIYIPINSQESFTVCYDTHFEKEQSLHMKKFHQGKKLLPAQISVLRRAVQNIPIIYYILLI